MTALAVQPLPVRAPIAELSDREPKKGFMPNDWVNWFNGLLTLIGVGLQRVGSLFLTGQAASIAATDFSGGNLSTGFYEIRYQVRITQAATTSSSITVAFGWTDGGTALSFAGGALTTNTTTSWQSGVLPVYCDGNTPVAVATTYASVGATPMKYALRCALVRVA